MAGGPTQRPFKPFGSFPSKNAAKQKIKELPWFCVTTKANGNRFGIVRKS